MICHIIKKLWGNYAVMRKIKIAMLATNLELNGISSVIMNYVRYLDLNKYELTIIAGKKIDKNYRLECYKRKVPIVELPHRLKNTSSYYYKLYKELRKGKFDIFHVHGSSATLALDLMVAKLAGVKIRIAHSHNTTTNNLKIHKLLIPIFNLLYTKAFACGKDAGEWLFGDKEFIVIPNGFDVEKFIFSKDMRNKFRDDNGINSNIVLGHIGRFNRQKNHIFILKVFDELVKLNSNYRLLLVGDGPKFADIKEKIKSSKNKDKIILYGETDSPNMAYMAMDKFILPSLYEGLPIALLEAQIAGLPAVVSNVITKEVDLVDNIVFESLRRSPKEWANIINNFNINVADREKIFYRNKEIFDKYKINKSVKILEKEYNFLVKKYNII